MAPSGNLRSRRGRRARHWLRRTQPRRREIKKAAKSCPALRYFALDGTDHSSHQQQASMIRRYIIWRNNHAYEQRLRRIVDRANAA
jgi:hypothetical protein